MLDIAVLDKILSKFLNRVTELLAVLVVDLDGLIIAQQSEENVDEQTIGAIMSILEQTIDRIKKYTNASYGSGTLDTDDYRLFYVELSGDFPAVFVIVVDPYANIEKIIPYSYLIAEKTSSLLNNREVSTNLPQFGSENSKNYYRNNNTNKLILIGDKKSGKSTLMNMYINGKFNKDYKPTIGVSFMEKALQLTSDIKIKFHIFDMGGLKSFAKIRPHFYQGANTVLLVFDYSRKETLTSINEWVEEAQNFVDSDNVNYILVGNKLDLVQNRNKLKERAENIADLYDLFFFEVSAATGQGIDELFTKIFSKVC
ncbi:MAG: GTP-binding protein [Promethearchaeia archaeon]